MRYKKRGSTALLLRYNPMMEQSPHILFVEDDGEIRALVARFLGDNSFRVTVARDGKEMDRALAVSRIDLLILDIMLPKEDGLSLCRRVRATSALPIIMLTARGSEIERVVGLEMGADDYLTKPFSTFELLARIRAVLRRAQSVPSAPRDQQSTRLTFAGWKLDLGSRRLHAADGTRVALTGGEFELLVAFCEHPNRVLTRDQLLDLTRSRAPSLFDRSIDVQVSRLRRKLRSPNNEIIRTIRNEGYLFVPAVTRA